MSKLLVYATGLFFLLYGAAFTLLPEQLSLLVTDASPGSSSAMIDVRATYGGMSVAVGIILFVLGSKAELISVGLLSTALILLAMATGRLLGMLIDGSPNTIMYIYLIAELAFGCLAVYLLRRGGDKVS